jgi:hypothetical protein
LPLVVIVLLVILFVLVVSFAMILLARKVFKLLAEVSRGSFLPRSVAASLKESRRYGHLIVQTAQQYPPGPLRDRFDLTLKSVNQWLANLNRLEQGLKKLYGQRNLSRELRRANFEIDSLRRKLLMASDEEAVYLRELMNSKKQHLAALKELQLFQTQAELKIHKIASDLGATHAEMLLVVARGDFNENRFRRLDENLQEHLNGMRDMLGAMEELGYHRASG